ncbi:cellulase family glycosylhydrolase [bacterium]|nr:cellulase family glycosylhydrolase [bacterium]
MILDRREFIADVSAAALGSVICGKVGRAEEPSRVVSAASAGNLPRWRGFNLLAKFNAARPRPFKEEDFAVIAEWGFDFVRLPLNYRCWSSPADWRRMDEAQLVDIDKAVEYGRKYGVHVNLNFHRAPGYATNSPDEKMSLWKDEEAQEACAWQWGRFAGRYKGVPSSRLSFNLINEPHDVSEEVCARVCQRLIAAIREVDAERLIIADGVNWATRPILTLADANVAQSMHVYDPMQVTHYRASWVAASMHWPVPRWPLKVREGDVWDRERLRKERVPAWKALQAKGVGVHVGEFGCFNRTPHAVALAWLEDVLSIFRQNGWGWALWNLEGGFGVLESGRSDVSYEDCKGRKLDRVMLETLRGG